MTRTSPLAIGMVTHGPHPSPMIRRQRAVGLGAFASAEGFALVQTFELTGAAMRDELTLSAMVDALATSAANVLLLAGEPTHMLTRIIDRAELRLVAVPETQLLTG